MYSRSALINLTYPRAVLFDWDNTLVKSLKGGALAFKNFLQRIGHNITEDRLKDHPQGSRHLFPKLFGQDWQKMLSIYHEELDKVHLDHLEPLTDAKKFLDILAADKVYMAVVSNKNGHFLRREIKHLLWDSYFASIVGCFDLSYDKPRPEPAYHVLEKGQVTPGSDVWFVGDSWVDYECAMSAGLTPILIGYGNESQPKLESALIVQDYKKLIELFHRLKKA